jgi:tetratricopeptide (TPR) repeat protein
MSQQRIPRYWISTAVFLMFCPPTSSAPGLNQDGHQHEVAEHVARAAAATQDRDFERAEDEWKTVVRLDPGSAQAFNNLGLIYYLEHKYPEAQDALGKALKLDPSLVNARILLGACLVRERKPGAAIEELAPTLNSRLTDSAEKTARVALHEAWFARGNYGRALDVLKPVAEKYPRDVDVRYNLGQTYLELAAQEFRQIALIDPQSYRIHQVMAQSLERQGQGHYRDAISEYRETLRQKPDLPGIHYQIGLLYRIYGDRNTPATDDAALQEFEAELKINPYDAASEYRMGRIYRKRQDLQNASVHFLRAVELDGSLVNARLALAEVLQQQGNLEQAQRQLVAATRLQPDNPSALYRLAQVYKQQGNEKARAEEMAKFEQAKAKQLEAQQRDAEQHLESALGQTAETELEAAEEQNQ